MIEQAITVTSLEIVILGQFFIHKDYSITRKDILLDILAKQYRDQTITIRLLDGENTSFSGFESFMKYVCDKLNIPYGNVIFESHSNNIKNFNLTQLKLGIFISVAQYLPETFNQNVTDARFVGCLLGRYNLSRFRLAYELDQAFVNDTYITFQPDLRFINDQLRHFGVEYQKELAWIATKQFDRDLVSTHHMGMIDWHDACRSYGNVWNKYQIEVISETDSMDNFWFTEKTANCLATGKPFVLVSGKGSLSRLKDMGFQTFNSVLDESYDNESNPYDRITHLTSSLQTLYTSSSKATKIQELYSLASQNIELYQKYCIR